jgi:hypothetical protein
MSAEGRSQWCGIGAALTIELNAIPLSAFYRGQKK